MLVPWARSPRPRLPNGEPPPQSVELWYELECHHPVYDQMAGAASLKLAVSLIETHMERLNKGSHDGARPAAAGALTRSTPSPGTTLLQGGTR
jgi:hypothetical protein